MEQEQDNMGMPQPTPHPQAKTQEPKGTVGESPNTDTQMAGQPMGQMGSSQPNEKPPKLPEHQTSTPGVG